MDRKDVPYFVKNKSKREYLGSITVVFSICFLLSLSLVSTALEAGRLYGLKVKLHMATQSALDSLFSGYQADIFESYGLFVLDTNNYHNVSDASGLTNTFVDYLKGEIESLKTITKKGANFFTATLTEAKIVDSVSITDFNGKIFENSVIQYMKYANVGNLVPLITNQLENMLEWYDGDKAISQAYNDYNNLNNNKKARSLEKEEDNDNVDDNNVDRYKEVINSSIIGKVKTEIQNKLLDIVVPQGKKISDRYIQKEGLPSTSYQFKKEVPIAKQTIIDNLAKEILFNEYLLSKFKGFTNATSDGVLQYELEYILGGQTSDRDNLVEVINRLLLIRTGLNMVSIMKSSFMRQEALTFATALVGGLAIPGIVQLTQILTMAAWAGVESIVDIQTLLNGKKVPIIKSKNEWNTSITNLNDIEKIGSNSQNSENGLAYLDYLRLLFLFQQSEKKYYYTMDVIQSTIQQKQPNFRLDLCIYGLEVESIISTQFLFFTFPNLLSLEIPTELSLSCKLGRSY